MKYLKLFEQQDSEPKVGDYVLIHTNMSKSEYRWILISNFINNTIGQIVSIIPDTTSSYGGIIVGHIEVKYTNIPKGTETWFISLNNTYTRCFNKGQIVAFGKTPEEVEIKLNAKKYNV